MKTFNRLPGVATSPLLLSLLSGTCITLGFPLVVPALAPTPLLGGFGRAIALCVGVAAFYGLITLTDQTLRRKLGLAYLAGLIHFFLLLHWLLHAFVTYGGLPLWQGLILLVLLAAYCSLFWVLVGLGAHWGQQRGSGLVYFVASVLAAEWLRGALLTGFPWGLWGYGFAGVAELCAWAFVGGPALISAAVALAGGLFWITLCGSGSSARKRGGIGLTLLGVALGCGPLVHGHMTPEPLEYQRITYVQPSIEQTIKNQSRQHRKQILTTLETLSRQAMVDEPELIIWPEAAYPGTIRLSRERFRLKAGGLPMLIGAAAFGRKPVPHHRNLAMALSGSGEILGRYTKRHLVPFGEYVPLREWLPVKKFVPGLVEFQPGDSGAPIGPDKAGLLICFDGVFPELARETTQSGARFLVNITNDGWYGVSSGPYQHLDFYVLRAIETGRQIVRVANNGVSTTILPNGSLVGRLELNQRAYRTEAVGIWSHETPWVRLGNWPVAVALLVLIYQACKTLWQWQKLRS